MNFLSFFKSNWSKIKYLKKLGIGLLIFFILFTVFGFFGLPPILKSILIKKLSENLKREVTIHQVKVNPYVLSTTVKGLNIKERGSSEVFLSFEELYLNLQFLSLFKKAAIIKEMTLRRPYIRINRNEDLSYNFSDLIPKKEEKAEKKEKPLRFSLNNIIVIDGSIDFWDAPVKKKHTVRDLNINIPFLSNIPYWVEIFVQPTFSAKINNTPYVIKGKTKPFSDSLETVVDLNIKELNLPYYLAYLPIKLNFNIVSAIFDAQANLSFIRYKDKGPSLITSGNFSIKNFSIEDLKKKPILKLPLIEIGMASSEPLKRLFHLSKIFIQSPELDIQRDSKGILNIESLLPEKKEIKPKSPSEKKGEHPSLSIKIDKIELKKGEVSFSDLSRPKPFKTKLDSVEATIDHFSNEREKKTNYILSLKTETNETIKLEGELSVEPILTKGVLDVDSLSIKKYSPYYMDRILFDIEDGRMDFATQYYYEKGEKEPIIFLSGISANLISLKLRKRGEREDFFKVPIVTIKDSQLHFAKKEIKVGDFFSEKGMLVVNRLGNGEFDLQKLIPSSLPLQQQSNPSSIKRDEKPWLISVGKIIIDQYTVKMNDQKTAMPITLVGEKIRFTGENLSTQKNTLGKISISLLLDKKGWISTKGIIGLDPLKIEGSLELKNISLKNYNPYFYEKVLFDIEEGDVEVLTNYKYEKGEKDQEVKLSKGSMTLYNLRLKKRDEEDSFVYLPKFSIKNLSMGLKAREVSIGEISTEKGFLIVKRYPNGRLNLQTLFPEPIKTQFQSSQVVEKPFDKRSDKPWLMRVGKISLDDYKVNLEDKITTEPVNINIENLDLKGEEISNCKNTKGRISISLLLNKRGKVSTVGTIGIDPIIADLKLDLKGIDIAPFQSYFTDKIKISVTEGSISTKGNLSLEKPEGQEIKFNYNGEAILSRFSSIDKRNGDDFLKWESLSFNDIHIGYSPLLVNIKGISLTDFYARVIINSDGKLNLNDIFEKKEKKEEPQAKAQVKEKPEESTKNKGSTKNIKIDMITLQGGVVEFTDRSIKPQFSARLEEIGGRVSGLSSEETALADLDLRAKLDRYAPLEIMGKINPLKEDLYVDLKVRFKDMDLSPMTPYSGKYVGYTIEKGKLSFDLKYLIEKRKLNSTNYIFLDQFSFGDKVESPHATKLPVKLAIALLKDRKGEIKLDIPVTGSLDDPKFSIGKIIFQIIVNLITKAVTSPFALLGSIFGAGEELSYLEFEHGSVNLTEANLKKIDTLIKVLYERPSLKIDIEGHVDLEKDREGLRQLIFNRKLKTQKLKEMVKKGKPPIPVDEVKIEPPEYAKYLKLAYKEEKFPKPKNILGFPKDLPPQEMEKLMLTHIEITESDLRNLASQRALRVKDAILKSGKVEPERIFIIEPKSLGPEKKEKLKDSRVDIKIK